MKVAKFAKHTATDTCKDTATATGKGISKDTAKGKGKDAATGKGTGKDTGKDTAANTKGTGKDTATNTKGTGKGTATAKTNNKRPVSSSESESESEDPYVYQTNCYFACFYPDTAVAKVLEIARKNPTYTTFAGPTAQVRIESSCLFISTNSDMEDGATLGFVSSANLTIESNEFQYPNDAWVDINIAQMEKIERKYSADVTLVTLFYELIVREFKKQNIPLAGLYCGWRTVSCSWELPE